MKGPRRNVFFLLTVFETPFSQFCLAVCPVWSRFRLLRDRFFKPSFFPSPARDIATFRAPRAAALCHFRALFVAWFAWIAWLSRGGGFFSWRGCGAFFSFGRVQVAGLGFCIFGGSLFSFVVFFSVFRFRFFFFFEATCLMAAAGLCFLPSPLSPVGFFFRERLVPSYLCGLLRRAGLIALPSAPPYCPFFAVLHFRCPRFSRPTPFSSAIEEAFFGPAR